MLKAVGYEVDYNFLQEKDGTRSDVFMDIQAGFKTYSEAEKWSHENTIDGKVVPIYPATDWD